MRRALIGAVRLLALVVVVPGCGLVLDFDPPDGFNLECFVTVRNPEGVEVPISSVTHPEFMNARRYFLCRGGRCPSTCSRRTVGDAEADWRIWARREIERVEADPSSTSTLRMAGGPWCEVPGTLRCEIRDRLTGVPPCDDITGDDLCVAPPVATDPCVEVSCPGPGCTTIDFGNVDVRLAATDPGERQTVTVSNCGAVDVRTQIDQTVMPVGALGEFAIPDDTFDCGPRDPDEMMFGRILQPAGGDSQCSFDIEFRPLSPREHTAQKVFWSEALPDHTIALRGFGAGGGLIDDAPDLICLEETTPCTAQHTILLRNTGPGPVIVRNVVATPANFEVTTVPATIPFDLLPGDPPFEVLVRWCAGPPGALTGVLEIETSERRIFVDLETRPTCP